MISTPPARPHRPEGAKIALSEVIGLLNRRPTGAICCPARPRTPSRGEHERHALRCRQQVCLKQVVEERYNGRPRYHKLGRLDLAKDAADATGATVDITRRAFATCAADHFRRVRLQDQRRQHQCRDRPHRHHHHHGGRSQHAAERPSTRRSASRRLGASRPATASRST